MARERSNSAGKNGAKATQDKPVRLRDLANYLGLSATTVSLVLNNSPVASTLSEETRRRVREAADKFNYKANYFARALNQKRNYQIGILVPDFGEGYNTTFITSIESELVEKGYMYFVSSHHWNEKLIEERLKTFVERGAEGVILINTPLRELPDIPAVVIGSQALKVLCTRIALDNEHGIRLALRHLYSLGHRKIALLKGHEGSTDAEPRWCAFVSECKRLGLDVDHRRVVQLERIHDGLDPIAEGFQAMEKLLLTRVEFTAVIAFNDMSGVGAIRKLKSSGYSIPGDVSIVGFDNVQLSQLVEPPLTTVSQPIENMARLATADVLTQIEKGEPPSNQRLLIEPELVVRGSTAPRSARPAGRFTTARSV